MSDLVNKQLVDELVKRQIAEESFIPKHEDKVPVQAKPLSPKIAMLLGNAADSASTYAFLKQGRKETNPAMKFFNNKHWSVIPVGIAANYGYGKLYDLLRKKNPKIANTAAGLLGGWHGALAGQNVEHSPGRAFDLAARKIYLGK